MNYYNEFDPKAAAWLRELIKSGEIPPGDVDERSITDIKPHELTTYIQCHFFAGIGGWSLGLKLAGWPADRPVWTGSCPCQPFSSAGKGKAQADERHLWPAFFSLIAACRPQRVFGEQVEAAIGFGWLDGVFADLESEGYACGASVLGAHSVGAPHKRQRLYWVANACSSRAGRNTRGAFGAKGESQGQRFSDGNEGSDGSVFSGSVCALADTASRDAEHGELQRGGQHGLRAEGGRSLGRARDGERAEADAMEYPESDGREQRRAQPSGRGTSGGCCASGIGGGIGMVQPLSPRLEGHSGHEHDRHEPGRLDAQPHGPTTPTGSAWDSFDVLPCTDGKTRRIEPGSFPLAHGVSGRVGLLRGYGNAIVPQVAAAFIQASEEALGDLT